MAVLAGLGGGAAGMAGGTLFGSASGSALSLPGIAAGGLAGGAYGKYVAKGPAEEEEDHWRRMRNYGIAGAGLGFGLEGLPAVTGRMRGVTPFNLGKLGKHKKYFIPAGVALGAMYGRFAGNGNYKPNDPVLPNARQ